MIIKKWSIYFVILILIVVSGCNNSPTDSNRPIITNSDWEPSYPAAENVDPGLLNSLTQRINNGDLGEISSLIIIRNNKLIYEEYFGHMTSDSMHTIYSVTKSFTSTMIGRLIDNGLLASVNLNLLDLFPQYDTILNMSPEKQAITLENVLQMRAGFVWNELSVPYSHRSNIFGDLYSSPDPYKFTLDQPMEASPGTVFRYNTGCTMLLGSIISRITGMNAAQYAFTTIFQPLNITQYQWTPWPASGEIPVGSTLRMKPTDMAKLGQLYLDNGLWNGERIISESWINQATQKYSTFSWGGYGYQWWLIDFQINGHNVTVPRATGYGDQLVYYIDELNMVVAFTSENYDLQSTYDWDIMQYYIIPATES
jgi:CubicO group peptidase (beta-lactamase class C family)